MKLLIHRKKLSVFLLIISLVFVTTYFPAGKAHAAVLSSSGIQMSDSRPSQTAVTYTVTFTFPSTTSIQCINIGFGSTAATVGTLSTTAPTGMTTTAATKGTLVGGGLTDANWAINTVPVNGILQLESVSGRATTNSVVTIPFSVITNTSQATFYAQVATYSTLTSHTCSGAVDSSAVMALATTAGVATTVTVDPSASLSVADRGTLVNGSTGSSFVTTTATTIPFGTVAAGASKDASQNLTVSTNASHGYTLYISDTGTLKNPNLDTLRDQVGTPGSPNAFDGTTSQSSFAYTAAGAGVTFGSNLWAGLANAQAQFSIATRTSAQNADVTPVQFRVMPSNTQAPGTYTTTVIYTLAPSY